MARNVVPATGTSSDLRERSAESVDLRAEVMTAAQVITPFRYAHVEPATRATVRAGAVASVPQGSHRAVYLSTVGGGSLRWLQIGVVERDGRVFLYVEDSGRLRDLGAALPGREYCVSLRRFQGRYLAVLDGRVVGSAALPPTETVAASEGYLTPAPSPSELSVTAGCA